MDRTVPAGAAKLLDFIGSIEAPEGYGTVYNNKQAQLAKPLTSMTVGQIIGAKPTFTKRFGSSACGRYQFMRDTLAGLVEQGAASKSNVFSEDLQDRLGYALLKRRGYARFVAGRITRTQFGKALAQEWASFPVLAATTGAKRDIKRGETFYVGDGLNKVLTTPAKVEAVLDQVLKLSKAKPKSKPIIAAPAEVPMPARKPEGLGLPPAVDDDEDVASIEPEAPDLPDNTDPSPALARKVQQLLKDKGYHEVGMVGTAWGPRSKDTLAAWKASWNRRHPESPVELMDIVDDDVVAKLESDEHRPVSIERATAEAKDLPDDTSWFNRLWNRVLAGLGIAGAGGAVVTTETDNGTNALEKVELLTDGAVRARGIFESIGGVIGNNWILIMVLLLVGGFAAKEYWKKRKVEKFRSGELVV